MLDTHRPAEQSKPFGPNKPLEKRKPVAVFYGASTSHTRAIAECMAEDLRACGFPVRTHSVWGLEPVDLGRCAAAVIVAPVHSGMHERAMVNFVKVHRAQLDRLPVAFISATLREAGGQAPGDAPESHAQFESDVRTESNPFFAETGWHPAQLSSFAGAISYTHYNFLVRWIMKLLAPKGGAGARTRQGPGGAQKDAGWDALDVFVQEFARENCAPANPDAAGPAAASRTVKPAS
jgi:menaquinone-dependent protoporphyrinogen oxidase